MTYIAEYFKDQEFACKCCGKTAPNKGNQYYRLLEVLDTIREHFSLPVYINSGYRCPKHNAAVGGVPNSQHVQGTAADIRIKGIAIEAVQDYIRGAFPDVSIGCYKTFTHIDTRNGRREWRG